MSVLWEKKMFRGPAVSSEVVFDVYDYFWACGHAAVKCLLPSAPGAQAPSVHTYHHHEVIAPAVMATTLGSATPRPGAERGLVDALQFRPPTDGPEMRMVESFLRHGLPLPKA